MPPIPANGSVHRAIRSLFEVGRPADLPDGELVELALRGDDPTAAAAASTLVDRHGPMVMRVCRSILRDNPEADDAFQATFLVLLRRGRSIRRADSIGPWLFGVARRVALRARTSAARRRKAEHRATRDFHPLVVAQDPPESWAPLYQELDRLPARYRDPLVLCYLQGLGHEQAAARLGCRLTTLRTRLARGKDRLRSSLRRSGLEPSIPPVPPPGPSTLPSPWLDLALSAFTAARRPAFHNDPAAMARAYMRWSNTAPLVRPVLSGLFCLAAVGALVWFGPTNPIRPTSAGPPAPVAGPPPESPGPSRSILRGKIIPFLCPPGSSASPIAQILPDGTPVRRGDLVCRLETGQITLEASRLERELAELQGPIDRERTNLELAQLLADEYEAGTYPVDRLAAEGRVEVARNALRIAQQVAQAVAPDVDPIAADRARYHVLRATTELREAEGRLLVLERYTFRRWQQELQATTAAIRDRLAGLTANRATISDRLKQLQTDLLGATFEAPCDGIVRHCSPGLTVGTVVQPGEQILWCQPAPVPSSGPGGAATGIGPDRGPGQESAPPVETAGSPGLAVPASHR